MRIALFLITIALGTLTFKQPDEKLSTIDFVQIVDDNKAETMYYYQNNWKALREAAIEKEYIHSFQLLETPFSDDEPFHLMLITTYSSKEEYDLKEQNFAELIEAAGETKLLNDKKPIEFRKIIFGKEMVKHWY